jgi:hypothetical protein
MVFKIRDLEGDAMALDLNRSGKSSEPISIAPNALIDAGVAIQTARGYLGASAVGHPCMRKVQFDWMCDPDHPARLRDIFARRHFFEAQSRAHFINVGFKFAPDDRLKFTALDGMFSGHADGIFVDGPKISDVAYPCLWEAKAINAKGWRSLDRDGLEKAYPQYAAQVALYQHYLGVDENPAILTAVNADSCERVHALIPFDAGLARATIMRAETVIAATRAGELLQRFTTDANEWRCRMCAHKTRCWRS